MPRCCVSVRWRALWRSAGDLTGALLASWLWRAEMRPGADACEWCVACGDVRSILKGEFAFALVQS